MNSQDPPSEQLQSVLNLYTHGKLKQALSESSQMLERFPNSVVLYNIAGASNAGLMLFDAAIDSYKQALKIEPNYAKAKANLVKLLTTYTPQKENQNLIVTVNEEIRKIDIKDNTSKIISDDQIVNLFSKS